VLPTLDDFRAQVDPDDGWSDDELLAQYRKAYPQANDRRSQRRAALLARQVAALKWLEQLLVTAPIPADPITAWLDGSLAARLAKGGVATVGDLIALMIDRGYHWYAAVPGLGRMRAARLVQWVHGFAGSLGFLPVRLLNPPRTTPAGAPVRPLVRVSDSTGTPSIVSQKAAVIPRRAPPPTDVAPLMDAVADQAAIAAWLDVRADPVKAHRAYRKEAERLLLWMHHERGRSFGQLTEEDAATYRDFLVGLGRTNTEVWPFRISQADWCAPRHTARQHPRWRPFEGALSAASVLHALSVVRSLFAWLTAVAYVPHDPWSTLVAPTAQLEPAQDIELTRRLAVVAWAALQAGVPGMASPGKERAEALLWLALVAGLGGSELASATTDRLYTVRHQDGGTRWMLEVSGEGGVRRAVPLPDGVMQRLAAWWEATGFGADLTVLPAGFPLVGRFNVRQRHIPIPLTPKGITHWMRRLLAIGQVACRRAGDLGAAGILAKAGSDWIRRTTGGVSAYAGDPMAQIQQQIQQLSGDSDIATTGCFRKADRQVDADDDRNPGG
jgi:site-specific recombinase XerC